MKTFHNPDHTEHESFQELWEGRFVRCFECPERMTFVLEAMADTGFAPPVEPDPVPLHALTRVHDADYLRFLETAHDRWVAERGGGEAIAFTYPVHGLRRGKPPESLDGAIGHYNFSVDTCINAGTWRAALSSAACSFAAASAVALGQGPAFALARPPGHHAHADLFGGYCYINNAAVAVETLRAGGAGRVALLDVDYHHGNGSQALFYDRADVLFVSLHADPAQEFPYFLGAADEVGAGAGEGFNLNLPMRHGTDWETWSEALETGCRRIADFGPDALVVSLGVDTYHEDPISQFRLDTPDFPKIGARIAALGLPTCWVMEGGYAVEAIGRNVAGTLRGFMGG